MKFKNPNVVCAYKFPWFAKKVICTTYNVLGISAVISGAIFVENIFFGKSETAYLSALFHKKIVLKEWITFTKYEKQNVVCAHEFSLFHQESRMYHIRQSLVFRLSCEWRKCAYDRIALTWCIVNLLDHIWFIFFLISQNINRLGFCVSNALNCF